MDSAWVRQGECHWAGPVGVQISAVRVGDDWRYVAWSGLDKPDLKYWDWVKQADFRVAYALGEMIPQRRQMLGVFGTAAEARAACQSEIEAAGKDTSRGLAGDGATGLLEADTGGSGA
jgi:hypothetical protein